MATSVRILAFSGSLRKASWNHMLVRAASAGATSAGAEVTTIRLSDFDLPIYNEELESASGIPRDARRLKDLFLSHHGLLLGCPEYNSSISAALKNAIDWVSRPAAHPEGRPERPLECFAGKVAGLVSASPGALGGLRGLVHVRVILGNIQTLVIPEQHALGKCHEAFDENGRVKDDKQRAAIELVGARVAHVCARLAV